MHELKSTQRQMQCVLIQARIHVLRSAQCVCVRVNIICVAIDIKFNKEFTFQIESTSSVKWVDP